YGHCKSATSLEETRLTCVCDIDREVAKNIAEEFEVKYFTDYKELVKSGLVDGVIVATHHWIHPEISIFSMENGLHVLSEKPISVTVSDADSMIEVAKKNGKVFSVMYQRRTTPSIKEARKIVESGRLGGIQRTMCIDPSYRAQAYYDSGTWRATWSGEGGGVLINQAPHGIDVFILLGGLPSKVEAKVRTKLHKIEVEDEACAFLEYPNGSWGYYYATTCEPAGKYHLELIGDKGKLVLIGDELKFYTFSQPISELTPKAPDMWASPEVKEEIIEIPTDSSVGHIEIIRNFARAIMYGEELISPGEEGLKSVEFINATILSGVKNQPVTIPVDREEYDKFIGELKKSSKPKKISHVQRVTDPRFGL
ncbi:MAG TPA: Gfo/Idh/MocA family oxidoreductase, partial [Candidatus Omnitrophica bacterium]|nr:Gfo/Idh/MocA family oxidoreductase [Candidatus Omnitrophota bacterium]